MGYTLLKMLSRFLCPPSSRSGQRLERGLQGRVHNDSNRTWDSVRHSFHIHIIEYTNGRQLIGKKRSTNGFS
jgi:hypothetical protein